MRRPPPAATDLVLAHALAAGARPRAILVDFAPFLLDGSAPPSEHLLPEVATPRDALCLGRLVPSVGGRRAIRSRLVGPQTPVKPTPPWFAGGRSTLDRMLYPADWRCLPARRAAVERLLNRAAVAGVAVHWLMPPFDPETTARRAALGVEARYTEFALGLMAEHPGLRVVDGRRLAQRASMRADPVHLNRLGAEAFTARVADALADPDAPRWADLGTDPLPAAAGSAIHDKRRSMGPLAAGP